MLFTVERLACTTTNTIISYLSFEGHPLMAKPFALYLFRHWWLGI